MGLGFARYSNEAAYAAVVVEVEAGESTEVAEGGYTVDWLDDDTLVVSLAQ